MEKKNREQENHEFHQIQENESKPQAMTERAVYFDILRVIAIFLVIYNHTNEKGYYLFSVSENYYLVPFYTALSVICGIAVPLFLMISGALLLPGKESIRKVYEKRISRILIVILLFSFMQYVYKVFHYQYEFSIVVFLKLVISSNLIIPYWYLYAYLAFLIILPFLRKMVRIMEYQDYIYLFLLQIIINGVGPYILYGFSIDKLNLSIPFLESIIFYPMMGYFIEYKLTDKDYNRKNGSIMAVLSLAVVVLSVIMTWVRAIDVGELKEGGNGLFVTSLSAVVAFTVFYFVKYFCNTRSFSLKEKKILGILGNFTFGIYLFEERFREYFVFVDVKLAPYIGWMPACFVWILVVFIFSFLTTYILKKIPGIRKIV